MTPPLEIQRLAAFSSDDKVGGNPAGVVIINELPSVEEMRRIAYTVGYPETVFAMRMKNDNCDDGAWRVRYFSPESEVPFCGHATIALGAALAERMGKNTTFSLQLNDTKITVEGKIANNVDGKQQHKEPQLSAVLQSPPTYSSKAPEHIVTEALSIFGYEKHQLDERIPPALANGGNNHLILMLKTRKALSDMKYDLNIGREFMNKYQLVTILIGYYAEEESLASHENQQELHVFHTRNSFASGGVYEDPATGSATAALAGYLRDIKWSSHHHGGGNKIHVVQGEDMGSRSILTAEFTNEIGSSIRVSGMARKII